MSSRFPAIVKSVDRPRREVRVEIPGITDGADTMPLAEIEYPIGDRSEQTEIRILEGDRVWVSFIGGDPRYPIITGFRAKNTGNEVGTRRWVHDNFESIADALYRVQAGESITLVVGGSTLLIEGGQTTLTTAKLVVDAPESEFTGNVKVIGTLDVDGQTTLAGVTSNGKDVGSTHRHANSGGSGTGGVPV